MSDMKIIAIALALLVNSALLGLIPVLYFRARVAEQSRIRPAETIWFHVESADATYETFTQKRNDVSRACWNKAREIWEYDGEDEGRYLEWGFYIDNHGAYLIHKCPIPKAREWAQAGPRSIPPEHFNIKPGDEVHISYYILYREMAPCEKEDDGQG